MAAKQKARAKAKAKANGSRSPLIGHNSDHAAEQEEMRKIAKAQRTLDKEKTSVKKDWRDREKGLTERLEKIGYTRDQFKAPYKRYCEIADCKNDDEAQSVRQAHRIFLAQQRKAFDALGHGDTIDWVDLIQDADEIRKLQEAQEAQAAAEAAASTDEPSDTPAEI